MQTEPEGSAKRSGPPCWMYGLSTMPGLIGGAYLGWYVGFNLLIWTAAKDTNWDHAIGMGFFMILSGMILAFIGGCIGAAAGYVLFAILFNR